MERFIELAEEEGAEILVGGKRPSHLTRGYFYEPTVFIGSNKMQIAQEEIFGPCLTVVPYAGGDAEAVRLANDTIYGLGAGVVSAKSTRAFNVARRISRRVCIRSGFV